MARKHHKFEVQCPQHIDHPDLIRMWAAAMVPPWCRARIELRPQGRVWISFKNSEAAAEFRMKMGNEILSAWEPD
jgi:hypothetical protein